MRMQLFCLGVKPYGNGVDIIGLTIDTWRFAMLVGFIYIIRKPCRRW